LEILNTHNNANPECFEDRTVPILCLDAWEHSYWYDYGPDVDSYVANFWKVLNWQKVNERLAFARRTQLNFNIPTK
jgi:superoxide dismutase, Fe-Mn family